MRITHRSFNKRMAMGLTDILEELREGSKEVEMNSGSVEVEIIEELDRNTEDNQIITIA